MSWISGRRLLAQVLLISGGFFLAAPAWSQERANKPQEGGFVEGRSGVVPEGAAELVTPATDAAIEKGLAWLSTQQNADGSFGSGAYRGNVAVTSLAAISFMASGSSPNRGPYGAAVEKALQYVLDNTSPSGFVCVANAATHGPMYSHGFGTLFLAEAYGMTRGAGATSLSGAMLISR